MLVNIMLITIMFNETSGLLLSYDEACDWLIRLNLSSAPIGHASGRNEDVAHAAV